MSRIRNIEIWKLAVPLSEAWRSFGSPKKTEKLDNLPSPIRVLDESLSEAENISEMAKGVGNSLSARRSKLELVEELRDDLLDELFNDNLSALGYRESPSLSSYPVFIEPDFFEFAELEWETNSAAGTGRRFGRIRIFDPYKEPNTTKAETGRVGSGRIIRRAILELKEEIPDFCEQPRKAACQLIRQKIARPEIKGSGLSDQNLAKYILEQCPKRRIIE